MLFLTTGFSLGISVCVHVKCVHVLLWQAALKRPTWRVGLKHLLDHAFIPAA